MLEAILTFLSKILGGFVARIAGKFIDRFKRPKIARRRAPENFFEELCPGTSLQRMREVLGAPHRESEDQYSYSFSDAFIQVRSKDSKSVTSIAAALPRIGKRTSFPLPSMNFALGKTRLSEVLDDGLELFKDSSSKHWGFYVRNYYGFSGLYRHYTFGVLEAPCIEPPVFEWDHDKDVLKSDPKNIVINWISMSGSADDGEWFDFWAFV